MSAEAFQTVLSCDMRTAPDSRSAEYTEAGTGQPRWLNDDGTIHRGPERGWATCYLYAEHAVRISAGAVRDQPLHGETARDYPEHRAAAAGLLDATADLVRLLALDHAHDAAFTEDAWQDRLGTLQAALDQARAAQVPEHA